MAKSWEDVVNEQAIAFAHLCAQNPRLRYLAEKDDSGEHMTAAETNEFFRLTDETMNNPFFQNRCMKDFEELEAIENPETPEEEPNSWDYLEHESYIDLFGPWWE